MIGSPYVKKVHQAPHIVQKVKTDNVGNKTVHKQYAIPHSNNRGCNSRPYWYTFAPVMNCRASPVERP